LCEIDITSTAYDIEKNLWIDITSTAYDIEKNVWLDITSTAYDIEKNVWNGSISKTVNMYGHEYILILQLSIEAHSVCCFWRLKYDANPVKRVYSI
jgi:hypothetical protein